MSKLVVNPQISLFAVEASASQVVDSSPAVDESALPVYKQVHQEQISAEQFVESVKEVPQERLPEPIEVPNKNTPIPHCIVAPTPAREGSSRWKRHFAAQVPVIEHVTPAPDAAHAASAPVVEHLAPVIECGFSSFSAAHAASTITDGIDEKLTIMIDMLDSCIRRYSLLWLLSSSVDLPHLPLPMQRLNKLLRNAADVHSTPLCLGSCKTRSSWLQTRGRLYDTPDACDGCGRSPRWRHLGGGGIPRRFLVPAGRILW